MDNPFLEIQLFGSFGAWRAGQSLMPLRSRAEKWLLALLALRPGHAVSREWLAATFWPDSEVALGLYNLRRCLTNLRKALGMQANLLLSPTPQTLCLDRAHVHVDVASFDAAIAIGSIESMEKAVALYRGPLLEDCYEDWALTARIEREQAYLAALETLAAHSASHKQPTAAVRYLRLTIAADPLREAAYGGLMQALADCGDYAALTQVYRDLRLLLHREFSIAPSAETEALYLHLQQQARQAALPPIPSALPPRRLPVPLTTLVGREVEIAEVAHLLRKERLVTLVGAGGVGKTRLAIAAGEALAPDCPDGVWFVELATLTDPALVAYAVAGTLGVKEEVGRPLVETLAATIASRSLLLILDNCEHLPDVCAALAEALLSRCSGLRLLATSREALRLAGEHRYHTPSLALPLRPAGEGCLTFGEKDLSWLMEHGAMRLFVERGTQVQPSFRLTVQNADAVLSVVRHLDGIPLAIELAAARVRSLSVAGIQARLQDCFALLSSGHRATLPRHQTLRALIDWSYDLLTEQEKRLLQHLSVFAGGWTLEAAQSVCAEARQEKEKGRKDSPSMVLDTDAVFDLLTNLTDKSLVVYEEVQGEARYRMLETIRWYANDRMAEQGERTSCRRRHRDFFLALAVEADSNLNGKAQERWMHRLVVDHDNLRQALAFCLETEEDDEIGLRLGAALHPFWELRGYVSEGREYLTALLARPKAQQRTKPRADALDGVGRLTFDIGDYTSARLLHEESLAIYRELGDRKGIANALSNLGHAAWKPGDNIGARSLYRESLTIYRELGDQRGIASSLVSLGNASFHQSDYASARSLYEEGLVIYRKLGEQKGIADTLGNLGIVISAMGDCTAARSLQEESLQRRREIGDREGLASNLVNLGVDYFNFGDYTSARPLFEESLALYRELGNRHGVALCLSNLGYTASRQGEYASAYALQTESLPKWRELGNRHGLAYCFHSLGEIACAQGDYAAGRSLYTESVTMFREAGDQRGIVLNLEAIASLHAAELKPEKTALLRGAAERLREEIGAPMLYGDRQHFDRDVAQVRAVLEEKVFAAAWTTGRTMTMEQALDYALAEP